MFSPFFPLLLWHLFSLYLFWSVSIWAHPKLWASRQHWSHKHARNNVQNTRSSQPTQTGTLTLSSTTHSALFPTENLAEIRLAGRPKGQQTQALLDQWGNLVHWSHPAASTSWLVYGLVAWAHQVIWSTLQSHREEGASEIWSTLMKANHLEHIAFTHKNVPQTVL